MSDVFSYESFLGERRREVLERVARAAARAGRDASEVEAIAVSKTVGPEEVLLAKRAGWSAFGENRPQELVRKLEALSGEPDMAGARFDMIGNLQKNKINQVIGRAALIHSVSSAHLAEAISSRCVARGIVADVLLEVNVSGEATKSGLSPDEARTGAEGIAALPGIRVLGLMTMAPARDADAARRTFSGLRELAAELRGRTGLALPTLSCGMSDDFEVAVEEGSTLIRLGRCVFDQGYALSR
ncbi:YggS family pyridoxal phosphate-dependent enzyme [Thermophilibacter mediterraneus]|uniref:YggS family pyridoxal phosphate-dependent enzyme n=1 Tax=Thermophilibacter mediterraneus TaxID=1871031 RepID=UPI00093003D2|nr:YggS family pyridoxal phosphate-dependent enzyme [Thermophilibacter mediterraneus]